MISKPPFLDSPANRERIKKRRAERGAGAPKRPAKKPAAK